MFSQNQPNQNPSQPTANLFGQAQGQPFTSPQGGGLFGSSAPGTGAGTGTQSQGLFGPPNPQANPPNTNAAGGLFGNANPQSNPANLASTGLFPNQSSNNNNPMFQNSNQPANTANNNALFANKDQSQAAGGGLFGQTNKNTGGGGIFPSNTNTNTSPLFGGPQTNLFGAPNQNAPKVEGGMQPNPVQNPQAPGNSQMGPATSFQGIAQNTNALFGAAQPQSNPQTNLLSKPEQTPNTQNQGKPPVGSLFGNLGNQPGSTGFGAPSFGMPTGMGALNKPEEKKNADPEKTQTNPGQLFNNQNVTATNQTTQPPNLFKAGAGDTSAKPQEKGPSFGNLSAAGTTNNANIGGLFANSLSNNQPQPPKVGAQMQMNSNEPSKQTVSQNPNLSFSENNEEKTASTQNENLPALNKSKPLIDTNLNEAPMQNHLKTPAFSQGTPINLTEKSATDNKNMFSNAQTQPSAGEKQQVPTDKNASRPILDGLKKQMESQRVGTRNRDAVETKQREPVYISDNFQIRLCEQSNQRLLEILKNESYMRSSEILEILESRPILEKIEKVLDYYKPSEEDAYFKQMCDEGRIKWDNEKPLNSISRELISLVADQLRVGIKHAYNLLNFYFKTDLKSFNLILNYNENMPNEQKILLSKVTEKVCIKSKFQLSKERVRLLQVIYQLLFLTYSSQNGHPHKETIVRFMNTFLRKNNYLEKLWENYIALCSSSMPENLMSYEEMNLWVENTLHEEFLVLKSIFLLCKIVSVPPELNLKMLEIFDRQGFQGSFHFHNNYKNLKMQEYYQNQLKLAQNIRDICILILLANMSMENLQLAMNSSIAPFSIFQKTGEKIFSFFTTAKNLQEISLVFLAFRNEILYFHQIYKNDPTSMEIPKYLYEYDLGNASLVKYENVNYLGYIRDMLSHEIFKNGEFFVMVEYRKIIKKWVELCIIQANEGEILQNYDFYIDILAQCFSEPYLAALFWEEDIKMGNSLPLFFEKIIVYFPLKATKFLKLLSAIICKNTSFSVNFIMKCLGNMNILTTEVKDIDSETIFSISEAHNSDLFQSLEDTYFNDIRIPKGTHYRIISKNIEGDEIPLVFQWDFKYNYWNTIFHLWTQTLSQLTEKPLETIDSNLMAGIKLICKALVANPKILFSLEQFLLYPSVKSSVHPSGVTIILLLIDSWFYFQRLKIPVFSLFSYIISALTALLNYEDKTYKTLVCFMIQLHPNTIMNVEKNRLVNLNEHPFFDIISLIKRHDNSVDFNAKKYNLILQILNFAYDIFKNEEYPLFSFPNEQSSKLSYCNSALYEQKIQTLAAKIQELHQIDYGWSTSLLEEINTNAEYLKNVQLKSSFLDCLLKTIYQFILPNYEKFLFLPSEVIKKFQIGNYLFKITQLLLSKFKINLERINIYCTQNIDNPLLKLIIKHLNDSSDLQPFILQTLQVHVGITQEDLFEEKEAATCIENKNWATYIQNSQNELDYSLRMALRNMIASCLSTVETILSLLEIYNENKANSKEFSTSIQLEVNNLDIVEKFYRIFSTKEDLLAYEQNLLTQNSSKQFSINFVLALASMLNFEDYKDLRVVNESLNNFDGILPFKLNESEMKSHENFLYSVDFTLGQNILLKGKTKSNFYQDSVCFLTIRIFSKLLIFWEGLNSAKKPLLSELLVSLALQSEIGSSFIYIVYKEMIRILFCCGSQPDEAIAVLEFMIIALHSQKNFIDPFLKDASLLLNMPNNVKLNKKFLEFCESVIKSKNPAKINKDFLYNFVVLICEIFKKEENYKGFVQGLRSNISFFQDFMSLIFLAFKPDSNYYKNINDLISGSNNTPFEQQLKTYENQYNRLKMENEINNALKTSYITLTAVNFINNEILKQPKNMGPTLSKILSENLMEWLNHYSFSNSKKLKPHFKSSLDYFLADLSNPKNLQLSLNDEKNMSYSHNDMSSYRSLYIKTAQPKQRAVLRESSVSILEKSLYKTLDCNEFGYGKNFLFDTQEIFYGLRICNYKNDFIYKFIIELQSYNLFNSIMDVEFKCLEGWVILFGFLSSLGEEGVGSSTMIYDTPIFNKQKQLLELFKNQKETLFVNPNNNYFLENGSFINLFGGASGDPEEECWKYLIRIAKNLITEFIDDKNSYEKDDIFRRYLNQNLILLTHVFSCLNYLSNKLSFENSKKKYAWDINVPLLNFFQNILINLLQFPQFSEINVTNFITVVFYYFSFMDSYEMNFPQMSQLKVFMEGFYELLKKNLECYPLIIYCLILITRNDYNMYINYYSKDGKRIIEHTIEKLSHLDTTHQEFISIIKFLIQICKDEKGCLLLKELGLINELCKNQKLNDNFEEYKDDNRNPHHILWCWVLILYKLFAKGLMSFPGEMSSALFFIKTYMKRFEKVLIVPLILSAEAKKSKLFSANIRSIPNLKCKYSLGFLEELDYTLQLLSVFFLDSKQWKEINKSQFDQILFYLSCCTIKLFKSNFSYTENYTPQTRYEKNLNEMYGLEKKLPEEIKTLKGIQPNNVVTSTATPMKMAINPQKKELSDLTKMTSKEIMSTLTQYYNPTLFIFQIEIIYQDILLSLMFSLSQGFPYSELCQYFDEQTYSDIKSPNTHPRYENYYWEYFAESINDCQIYKRQTAQKWIAHEENMKKSLRKLEVVRNSVENGIYFGSLNTIEKVPEFENLIKYSIAALTMSFEVAALHFEIFLEYKKIWNVLMSDIIKAYKEKTIQNIEESDKLLLKYISKSEEIPNFSIVNFSVEGSIEKKGGFESKSEMSETQKRISFMTCIKYHIYNLKI